MKTLRLSTFVKLTIDVNVLGDIELTLEDTFYGEYAQVLLSRDEAGQVIDALDDAITKVHDMKTPLPLPASIRVWWTKPQGD